MEFDSRDIENWDKIYRLKLINSITGYKSPHLVGTISKSGILNLGVFSSVFHVSSNPARIGIVFRPEFAVRHTLENIRENGSFTLNIVQPSFLEKAHFAAANWEKNESEFVKVDLTPEYFNNIEAPFVKESGLKIGCKLIEEHTLKAYPSIIVIGEIIFGNISDNALMDDGQLDLEKIDAVSVTGLNQYSVSKKLKHIPYPRVKDVPNFKQKRLPDNISFDESKQQYVGHLLKYASNVGAPVIKIDNTSNWQQTSINTFNHVFANKAITLKEEYEKLEEELEINQLLYNTTLSFEPVIGEVYHLYSDGSKNGHFLSIIPPQQWNKEHLGSFRLTSQKIWKKV